jgi:hypothetical protein
LGTSRGWRLPALSGPHRGKDLLTHQGLVPRMTCNSGREFTRSLPRKTATGACACGKSCCQSAARIGPLTMRFIDKWQGGAQSFCRANPSGATGHTGRYGTTSKGGIRW